METQLDILSESLDKKIKVLNEIQKYNLLQENVFKEERVSLDDFDKAVSEKEKLIDNLMLLDEGFETMYARLSEELKASKDKYADKIKILQEKSKVVSELSVAIQAQESRNKVLVEKFFKRSREEIGNSRRSSKAAFDYYKSMSGANYPQNNILDSKK